jgi:beta-glucanase (GH16 family)
MMRRKALIFIILAAKVGLTGCGVNAFEINPIATARVTSSQEQTTPFGRNEDWNLIFSDDFHGTSLDPDKWTTCYWWDDNGCTIASNAELQWYQPDDVLVEDGILKLRAQKRRINAYRKKARGYTVYDYTSGIITTGRESSHKRAPVRFIFKYGYAEIRAKIPQGKGLWPAFWLLPENHNSKPEIDVMEIYGDQPSIIKMNFHYNNGNGRNSNRRNDWAGPDFSANFHRFAVDWRPNAIIWYVDGIERWRYTDTAHIPSIPMYLLVNLAVGGSGPGAPETSTSFPSYYEIDYVKVWRRASRSN